MGGHRAAYNLFYHDLIHGGVHLSSSRRLATTDASAWWDIATEHIARRHTCSNAANGQYLQGLAIWRASISRDRDVRFFAFPPPSELLKSSSAWPRRIDESMDGAISVALLVVDGSVKANQLGMGISVALLSPASPRSYSCSRIHCTRA